MEQMQRTVVYKKKPSPMFCVGGEWFFWNWEDTCVYHSAVLKRLFAEHYPLPRWWMALLSLFGPGNSICKMAAADIYMESLNGNNSHFDCDECYICARCKGRAIHIDKLGSFDGDLFYWFQDLHFVAVTVTTWKTLRRSSRVCCAAVCAVAE